MTLAAGRNGPIVKRSPLGRITVASGGGTALTVKPSGTDSAVDALLPPQILC
jgi:hypothetical protein